MCDSVSKKRRKSGIDHSNLLTTKRRTCQWQPQTAALIVHAIRQEQQTPLQLAWFGAYLLNLFSAFLCNSTTLTIMQRTTARRKKYWSGIHCCKQLYCEGALIETSGLLSPTVVCTHVCESSCSGSHIDFLFGFLPFHCLLNLHRMCESRQVCVCVLFPDCELETLCSPTSSDPIGAQSVGSPPLLHMASRSFTWRLHGQVSE